MQTFFFLNQYCCFIIERGENRHKKIQLDFKENFMLTIIAARIINKFRNSL